MYPIHLVLKDKPCLVIGGMKTALQKVKGLLAAQGDITVVAPTICKELADMESEGLISWIDRFYEKGDEKGYFVVICACGDKDVDKMVALETSRHGQLLNVVDVPELCNFFMPSVVRRGDLLFSIGTNGKSPALSKYLRLQLEDQFGPVYSDLVAILGQVREEAMSTLPTTADRGAFWRTALEPPMMDLVKAGKLDDIKDLLWQRLAVHIIKARQNT